MPVYVANVLAHFHWPFRDKLMGMATFGWERRPGLFEQQKDFLSDKLLLFKTLAATLLPEVKLVTIFTGILCFKQYSIVSE